MIRSSLKSNQLLLITHLTLPKIIKFVNSFLGYLYFFFFFFFSALPSVVG